MPSLNAKNYKGDLVPLGSDLINSEIRMGSNLSTLVEMAKRLGEPGQFVLEADLEDKMAEKINPWLHYDEQALKLAVDAWEFLGHSMRERIATEVEEISSRYREDKFGEEHANNIDRIFGDRIQKTRIHLVKAVGQANA